MGRAWKIRKEEEGARILEKRNSLPKNSDFGLESNNHLGNEEKIRNPQSAIRNFCTA
jgi:hypothetical protein